MQGILSIITLLSVTVAVILAIQVGMYRRQIKHIIEELSMLQKEDTNYKLSSFCRVGKMYQIVEQINEIVGNYRKERAALKNENRTYRESITSISHDIRTPLTSVKGYLQMLSGSCICEEKQQAYIKVVEERVDAVTNMLNQLFEYTRVEAGEWEFHMEQLNLTNIFMDTISMFYDDFVQRDCEPRLEIPQIPCFVYGDRQACIRIIENLIKNALVHGTGEYSFCMKKKACKVFLEISNRTDSVEPKDIDRIFERFYTTDMSRTRKTTGLGLAIVKQLANRMHGEVTASLEGTMFAVQICMELCSEDCSKAV